MKKLLLSLILFFIIFSVSAFGKVVTLAWDAPVTTDVVVGYNIYRSLNSDGASAIKVNIVLIPSVTLTFSDYSASEGYTYYYYATATYDAGESDKSNIVKTTILPTDPVPVHIESIK